MVNERLLADLRSADQETRLDAYEEISIEMDDDLAKFIAGIATGPGPDAVRADAAVALGPILEEFSMDEEDAPVSRETFTSLVEQLRALYDDESQPKLIRRRAFESLVRDPQPWQRDEIRRLASSPDADWRLTSVFGMGSITGFENQLLEILAGAEGLFLAEAVRAAGSLGLVQARDQIRKLARDKSADHDVRIEAILALPHVDRHASDILGEIVSDDPEIEEAVAIALDELV